MTKTKTFRGELVNEAGDYLGKIHAVEGGYVVRDPKEFARDLGPVIFGGKVFKGSDFAHVRNLNIGYTTIKMYQLREAA